jgi:hypothetical protein
LLLVVVLGLAAGGARAAEPARSFVHDGAGLFSKDHVTQANRLIADIRETYEIDLVIETFKEAPPESEREKKALWKARERKRTLREWAQRQAEKEGVDGIYVAIFDPPNRYQRAVVVVGWPEEREKEVSWVKRGDLQKLLARELDENRDKALLQAVDLFRHQMRMVKGTGTSSPLDTWVALALVGGLLGVWVLLMLNRFRQGWRAAQCRAAPIYQPATMAALFGVPASFWVNDQLFKVIPPETPIEELPADVPLEPAVEPAAAPQASEQNTDSTPVA